MTRVKKSLINPVVIEMLQNELNDLQDDLCLQCGAENVFHYAQFDVDQQQCVMYTLVNSDDEKINKLRNREARLMEILRIMGERPESLEKWLDKFTRESKKQ